MLKVMKDRDAADWEELARREPYFAVLTNEGFLGVESNTIATRAFFDTGEADISSLLATITTLLGRDIPLTSALDFGCGVGRLTLPLARRAGRVVACDVAPTMLAHARQNAEGAGLYNVTFIASADLAELPRGCFDFVCSLLVLQHIPPAVGYGLIRTLLSLLAPGGVAALHTTFERPGSRLRRLARSMRGRSRFVHRTVGIVRRERLRLPHMQMNEYDERVVDRDLETAGARVAGRFATRHGNTNGAVLVIQKPSASAPSA
jgi:2-polyprenyl-3-methyl-5-hydroxy-6-metoxy-1,4-benzoquinol methylase